MYSESLVFDADNRLYMTDSQVEEYLGIYDSGGFANYVGDTLKFYLDTETQNLIMQGTIPESGDILLT